MIGWIPLGPRSLARKFWAATAIVLALGVGQLVLTRTADLGNFKPVLQIFNLDAEACLPAWYSSTLMMLCALLLAGHAAILRKRSRDARRWGILAVLFVYLSLDEQAGIHELGGNISRLYDFQGFLRFSWVVVAAPLIVIGGLYFLPFLRRLPSPFGRRFFWAGVVFVTGAFGMEMIGGYVSDHFGRELAFGVEVIAEESLEMIGLTLFFGALLDCLAAHVAMLALDFRAGGSEAAARLPLASLESFAAHEHSRARKTCPRLTAALLSIGFRRQSPSR